jgi:hypothetical protein
MQGLSPDDDPADSALVDRFYTGRSNGWQRESIDLTPYAGKEIQIRFAYLTDLICIALDDIEIPEIGFFDDAETPVDGWVAEGFERVTGEIPQQWHIQLITFPNGVPTVQFLPLSEDQTLELPLSLAESGGEAILIVAASAPMTLETAGYELVVSE